MKKLYAGIVLNKDELTESNSNRIELEKQTYMELKL